MDAPWIRVLDRVADALDPTGIDWMLLGSAATAVRGVPITPGDIDIEVGQPDDIRRAAGVLPTPEAWVSELGGPEWGSTLAEPATEFDEGGARWTFGLWMIDGVKVELACIECPETRDLFVEARSDLTLRRRQRVRVGERMLPVVPLEPQLVTMAMRGQHDRLAATLAAVGEDSIDASALREAIDDRRREYSGLVVPPELARLLEPPER